jgi:flagellar biosynthetic protein FliP
MPVPLAATRVRTRAELRAVVTDRRFLRHYAEMLVAMVLGMVVLLPLWELAGLPDVSGSVELHSLLMATSMTVGMGAWMLVRRHSWAAVAEMAAAMYLPFAVLVAPFWAGVLDGHGVMVAGHVLMLPAMLLAMLRRPGEYLGHRH